MNKKLVLLLMIMTGGILAAQELTPYGSIEVSYYPSFGESNYIDGSWVEHEYSPGMLVTDLLIGASWGPLFLDGEIITMADTSRFTSRFRLAPFQDEYYIRAGLRYNGLTLAAEHVCYHPIVSLAYTENTLKLGGGSRVYFRMKF